MGMSFEIDGEILWAPALQVGRLFHGQANLISELFGEPSGVGEIIADDCQLDPPVFSAFVTAMVRRYERSQHVILRSLLEGFLVTALALADRAGLAPPDLPAADLAAWQEAAARLERKMPR
jgi:hypothetical protein